MSKGHTRIRRLYKLPIFVVTSLLLINLIPSFFLDAVNAATNCADPSNFSRTKKNYCKYLRYWENVVKPTSSDLEPVKILSVGEEWTQGTTATKDYIIYSLHRSSREANKEPNKIVVADKNLNPIKTFQSADWGHMHSIWYKPGTNNIRIDGSRDGVTVKDRCYNIDRSLENGDLVEIDCNNSGIPVPKAYNNNGLTRQGEVAHEGYVYTATWDSGAKSWVKKSDLKTTCVEGEIPDDQCQYKFTYEQMHYERDNNAIFVRNGSGKIERIIYIDKRVVRGELESVSFDEADDKMLITIAHNPDSGNLLMFYKLDRSIYDPKATKTESDAGDKEDTAKKDDKKDDSTKDDSKKDDSKKDDKEDDSKKDASKKDDEKDSKDDGGDGSEQDGSDGGNQGGDQGNNGGGDQGGDQGNNGGGSGSTRVWTVGGDEPAICSTNASDAEKKAAGCNKFGKQGLENSVVGVINAVISVLGILAVIGIIYGGIQYMTSNGNTDKIQTAKRIIIYCAIGLTICILSVVIVNFIVNMTS